MVSTERVRGTRGEGKGKGKGLTLRNKNIEQLQHNYLYKFVKVNQEVLLQAQESR